MSPRGAPFRQLQARAWAQGPGLVILCPRFEGVDERIIRARRLIEVSIGDYVLSGGEIAALAILDACVRLIPGVMGKVESGAEESFEDSRLEYPHYTRPREFEGETIPQVLLSGDHARIAAWRRAEAERITASGGLICWGEHGRPVGFRRERREIRGLGAKICNCPGEAGPVDAGADRVGYAWAKRARRGVTFGPILPGEPDGVGA